MYFPTVIKTIVLCTFAACPAMTAPAGHHESAKAVFFITNDVQNSIVALPVQANGLLGAGSITSTGGKGLQEVNGTRSPTLVDGLASQGSVRVSGHVSLLVTCSDSILTNVASVRRQSWIKFSFDVQDRSGLSY
jgi:hypothetical protein